MNTAPTTRRRGRAAIALGAAALVAVALAGCEAQSSSGSGSTPTSSAGDSALAQTVAKLEQPLDAYPVPTDTIADVASLKGKTVYYIPVTLQAPIFGVVKTALGEALGAAGITLQACDGKGTPTDVAACLGQATDAKAGAIITDGIPYQLAANAFDAAEAAGIPVIVTNQQPADNHPNSDTVHYITGAGTDMQVAAMQWFTLDSEAKGKILINQSSDGPTPVSYVKSGQAELDKICPDCEVTINEISSANFALVPSSTSSALLKNQGIGYVESQFEQFVQPTQAGVQQAGMTATVKGLTTSAQLGSLQALANSSFLYAGVAQATSYQGWVDADAALRMMSGVAVPEYTIPIRLFTRDNVKDITLTDAAQQSGEWFGPTTFPDDFEALWGLK